MLWASTSKFLYSLYATIVEKRIMTMNMINIAATCRLAIVLFFKKLILLSQI